MTNPIDPTTYGAEYIKQYEGSEFEPVLVAARRREVLAAVSRHPHRRLLEIGCGIDPLFQYVSDTERDLVVEPVPDFADRARALAGERSVEVHTAYLGEVVEAARVFAPDFIVASSLLHEVPDATALLREVNDSVTSGGAGQRSLSLALANKNTVSINETFDRPVVVGYEGVSWDGSWPDPK